MGVDWGSEHFISGKGGFMHRTYYILSPLQWQTLRVPSFQDTWKLNTRNSSWQLSWSKN